MNDFNRKKNLFMLESWRALSSSIPPKLRNQCFRTLHDQLCSPWIWYCTIKRPVSVQWYFTINTTCNYWLFFSYLPPKEQTEFFELFSDLIYQKIASFWRKLIKWEACKGIREKGLKQDGRKVFHNTVEAWLLVTTLVNNHTF